MITPDEYVEFCREYYQSNTQERFGQAFVNRFGSGIHPELFYEEDLKEAVRIIFENYII